MSKAKKLPSKSWRCQVFDYSIPLLDENGNQLKYANGRKKEKKIYKSFTSNDPTAAGKREVEYLASQYARDKEAKKRPLSNHTFNECLDNYINLKEGVLSPSTIRGYRTIQKGISKNFNTFDIMKVSEITQDNIQELINSLATSRSPKTVRNYHGLISSVLRNTMIVHTTLPQKTSTVMHIPTDEEIVKLVKLVENTSLEIPILLGAFCMMRRGEICGLSLDDIQGNVIHIRYSLVLGSDKKWYKKAPKTESSDRYVEAPEFVINRIRESGHITDLNPHSITLMFQRVLARNNIPHFRFHDLRHYSASVRHALGIPDAYIMADGGWKSDRVLKNVYRHAMSDRRKEMSEIATDHFNSMLHNTKHNTK